jgi:hypothetical protein
MAHSHPIFVGTLGHMPVAYLQVSDLLSQFIHLFEDDKLNCGVIQYPRICAVLPKTWIQIAVLSPTLLFSELRAN